MLANILPLHTPLILGCGQKSFFLFSVSCQVAYQINRNEAENRMQANSLPFYKPTTTGWGQKVKQVSESHVAYQIKRKVELNIIGAGEMGFIFCD